MRNAYLLYRTRAEKLILLGAFGSKKRAIMAASRILTLDKEAKQALLNENKYKSLSIKHIIFNELIE
jgi:predicted GIY-YIG superfamily endonuclease